MRKEVKLGDICNILNGYAFKSKEYVEDGIRVIRITNVQKGNIEDNDPKYYDISKIKELKNYMLKENDLLISLTGNVGRVGLLPKKLLPAGLNQRVGCLRIKDEKNVSIEYLYQYFNSYNFERNCINNSKGIAQKNLSTEWLKNYKMSIPNLNEQNRIVNELKKIQRLKKLKEQQLKELNQLIKSQFVEMFGNIHFNDKKWNKNKWRDVLIIKNGKNQKKVESFNGKYPIYGSGGIIGFANDYICNENSIIIGRKGSINKPILVKTKFWNVDTAFGLEPIKEKIKADYLYYFCCFYNFEKHNKAVTIPSLTKKDLLNIEISVPPITLQNQFAEIVKQIDKQKFEIEKSLKETQELYESLMEKYFG